MEYSIFGCKVNKFYLNKRLSYFAQRQVHDDNSHLMATCVVTDRAKTEWVKSARKLLDQGKRLYLTGCGAFEKGEAMDYEKFFGLYPSLITYKERLTLLGEDPSSQTDLGDIGHYDLNREMTFNEAEVHNVFTKKYVVIQSGCDTFCTFCLTIYKRGGHRRRPLEEILDEINHFVDQGGKEIVITGVNLAARGASHTRKPRESQFSTFVEALLKRTAIQRIRISSLGPEFLDDRFFEIVHDERFLPHFHVSIQHFDDEVLRRMNRNYSSQTLDYVLRGLRSLQRPDQELISIGADLIVGFPGETEEAFQRMKDAVETYGITKLHAFPFSPHQKGETVPAGGLKNQVPLAVKKQRMEELLEVGEQIRDRFVQKNRGRKRDVLLEAKKDGIWTGWTPNYLHAAVEGDHSRGQLVSTCL